MKPPSIPQLQLVAYVVNRIEVKPGILKKAMSSAKDAYRFINEYKPKLEKLIEEEELALNQEPIVDEETVIRDVTNGRCMDSIAEVRGLAIIELLALKMKGDRVDTIWGDKTAMGLYRTVIRAIVEAKEPLEVEIMMCAACQLELSVEAGTDSCPRCGSQLQEPEQGE